jgi:predicted  nucleic acid-binding Zn-ribbon protein
MGARLLLWAGSNARPLQSKGDDVTKLEMLNMLRLQQRSILRQVSQLDARIGELRRHTTMLRRTNRTGDELVANTEELETAQRRRGALLDQAMPLGREIAELSERIIDEEMAQHQQAQDELGRAWQSHPDALRAWKVRRRRELVEMPLMSIETQVR